MTSTTNNLKISSDDHLDPIGPDGLRESQYQEKYERARRHCVELLYSSPLHQARAAKNPNYWNELKPFGGWNLTD